MRWSPPEQKASGPSPVKMIDPDLGVVPGDFEGVGQLEEGLRPKGVADLGPTDRDLGDPLGDLVADVPVLAGGFPGGQVSALRRRHGGR